VTYTSDEAGLNVALRIVNTGEKTLPASVGDHPAFNRPLQPGRPKESYALTFANEESFPVRRLDGGLLRMATEPSPVKGKVLPLSEALFTDDAVIFDRINSTSVRYAAGQGPKLEISWSGFRELGIWSKRRPVLMHRAVARLCQPRDLRRRVQRQAGFDAYCARRRGDALVPGCGRAGSASLISHRRKPAGPAARRTFRISRSSSMRLVCAALSRPSNSTKISRACT
jgi:hypothetical protein